MHSARGGIEEESKDFSPFFLLLRVLTNILGSGSTVSKSQAIVKCTLGAGGVGAGGGIEEESEDFTLHSTFADRPTVLPRPPSAPEVVSLSFSLQLDLTPRVCRTLSLSLPFCRFCRFVDFVVL